MQRKKNGHRFHLVKKILRKSKCQVSLAVKYTKYARLLQILLRFLRLEHSVKVSH